MKKKQLKPKLSFRRFEFKYLMPAKLADAIVASIGDYVVHDLYTGKKDFYYVNSVYLDNRSFHFYQEKLNGLKNRKKYRFRYYGDLNRGQPKPLFLEIKRKIDAVVTKDRCALNCWPPQKVTFSGWKRVLKENVNILNEFYRDYLNLKMEPCLFVRYKRKPYFSKFNKNFRITFDYDLQAARIETLVSRNLYFRNILNNIAVMEVKFNGNVPAWFSDILKANNLKRMSFSKYCNSLNIIYNLND